MAQEKPTGRKEDVHDLALQRFGYIWSAVQEERELAITDRRFVGVSGAQWEGSLGDQFENKVKIEVDKVSLAVERVDNEYRSNRITVDFTSKDGSDGDRLADVMDGLYRADEQYSGAKEAYDTAYQEGITGGYGAWRLTTEFEDENDDENEHQRIISKPIYDADKSVFFDQNAKRQDKSDAQFCFVIESIDRRSYEAEYSDDVTSWPISDETKQFDWSTPDVVYVADYYVKTKASVELVTYRHADGTEEVISEDQFERDEDLKATLKDQGARFVSKRTIKKTRVVKYIMSGGGILSGPEEIPGPNIPVVPYYGRRVYVDGLERCSGIVRRGKDVQRLKNIMLSKLAEQSASSGLEKPIFDPEQITPAIAQMWADDPVKNNAYQLAVSLRNQAGDVTHAGPVAYTRPPAVAPAVAALTSLVDQDLNDVLGNMKAAEEINANTSGKAIELVQNRLDQQSFKYMDNLATAMKRAGEIWLGMAREIYVEDDRKMKTIGSRKEVGSITLGDKVIGPNGQVVSEGDLSRANFDVNVEVGPSSSSKRQSMVRTLGGVLQSTQDPETMQVMTALIIQNIEGEGMSEVHEWQRKKLVGMGVLKPTEDDIKEQTEAAANQQADPNAEFLQSEAEKNMALAQKAQADTQQSVAKTANLEADTAGKIADIPRADRQQVIDAVTEIDREGGRRTPNQPINNGLSNGIPPDLEGV